MTSIAIDPGSRFPALADSRRLRLFAVFVLYVAQGVPFGLFWYAIPAWMAARGADAGDVGYVLGLTALPWSLKFVNGFVMDRYTFLAMGRRRVWLIGAQLVMILCLIGCSFIGPAPSDVALLGAIGFVVNAATTVQDVAIDGMAVDVMQEDERARASGMMFGGQSIGIAASAAASGAIIAEFGISAAYATAALLIALVTVCVLLVRERAGERLLPWSEGAARPENLAVHAGAWWPILRNTIVSLIRPMSLVLIPVLMLKGATYGAVTGITPLIATQTAGWAEDRVTSIAGTGQLVAGLLGLTLFGWLGDRIGAKRAAAIALTAFVALFTAMRLLQPQWDDSNFLTAFIIVSICFDVMLMISLVPIAMRLSHPAVAATQFTLYMALANFGISIGAWLVALSRDHGGAPALFVWLVIAQLAALAILLVARVPEARVDALAPPRD